MLVFCGGAYVNSAEGIPSRIAADAYDLRSLEPSAHPNVAVREIRAVASPVIVVSHEPVISSIGAALMSLPAFPQFRTAQCCALENGKPTFTARADLGTVTPLFVD